MRVPTTTGHQSRVMVTETHRTRAAKAKGNLRACSRLGPEPGSTRLKQTEASPRRGPVVDASIVSITYETVDVSTDQLTRTGSGTAARTNLRFCWHHARLVTGGGRDSTETHQTGRCVCIFLPHPFSVPFQIICTRKEKGRKPLNGSVEVVRMRCFRREPDG